MDTRLPSERPFRAFTPRRHTRGNGYYEDRHEECFAYDLQAFGGCGAPVVISEGFTPGSNIWTVFLRKLNGTGLRHVVGSPEGTLAECRSWVAARVARGRYVAWSADQQARAKGKR